MFRIGRQEPSRTPSIPAAPIKYGYISMWRRAKTLTALTLAVTFSGCATYPAENFLRLTHSNADMDKFNTIAQTRKVVVQLLDHLNVPEGRRTAFEGIVPIKILREAKYTELLSNISDAVVLANGDIDIALAFNSIIVANGNINISHSGNNIVVSANNIDISADGKMANGSLLVAKGHIKVGHAENTIVSSQKGPSISHAKGVIAYNTLDRKTSWGQINNLVAKPLFPEDKMSRQVAASTAAVKADAGDKLAHEIIGLVQELGSVSSEASADAQRKLGTIAKTLGNQLEGASKSSNPQVAYRARAVLDEFRTPKWPDAEVHMVCLYESGGRKVVVEVQQTKKPVILIVCASDRVVWDIQASPGAEIVQVIASGYRRQRVEGATVPVASYSYDENSGLYFFSSSETMPTDANVHARVRQLTGKEIASYQGRYNYGDRPFVINSEQ